MFLGCHALVEPKHPEIADIKDTDGLNYVNANICPAPAKVYDAVALGASIGGGTLQFSIFHQIDGVSEETANSSVDILSGSTFEVLLKYQNGLTDANLSDTIGCVMISDFAGTRESQMYWGVNTVHAGTMVTGKDIKLWVANGTVLIGHDDSASGHFRVEEK